MTTSVQLQPATRRSAPLHPIVRFSNSLIERIGGVLSEFTTTVSGIKGVQKGLSFARKVHSLGVKYGKISAPADGNARGKWALVDEYDACCDNAFAPLGLASIRNLFLDSQGELSLAVQPTRGSYFKKTLLTALNVVGVAVDVMGAGIWFAQRGLCDRQKIMQVTSFYEKLGCGLTLGSIAHEIMALAIPSTPGAPKIGIMISTISKVINIALPTFGFVTTNVQSMSKKIPDAVKHGIGVFSDFYKFAGVFSRGWQKGGAFDRFRQMQRTC